MINPAHLTDDLAHKVAHEVVCSCCKDELVRHARQGLIRGITTAIVQYIFKAKKPVVNFAELFKRLLPHEKKMAKTMKRIWEKERKIIVANLKKLKKAWIRQVYEDFIRLQHSLPNESKEERMLRETQYYRTKDKIDNIVDSILYPTAPFEKEIAADMAGISVKVIDEQGTLIMDGLDVDVAFDVYNPEVTKWMKGYYPMLSKELETVNVEKLRRELIEGLEAGEGIPQLTNRVNTTYANWNKFRSTNIARSEVLRASNRGNLESWRQSGVVKSMSWMTFFDRRTCPWCEDMDGKVVSIEDNFFEKGDEYTVTVSGKEQTMNLNYTDTATPPLHPMCRCSLYASFEEVSVTKYAKDLSAKATKAESRITRSMRSIAARSKAKLERLEFRLKTQQSIERKLRSITKENPGITMKQATGNIKDTVRYTATFPEENFVLNVNKMHAQLEAQGYNLEKVSNYYGSKGAYQGINAKYVDPKSGLTFEVQYHTKQSLKIAEKNHLIYEKARVSANAKEVTTMNNQMVNNWGEFRLPEGAEELFKQIAFLGRQRLLHVFIGLLLCNLLIGIRIAS